MFPLTHQRDMQDDTGHFYPLKTTSKSLSSTRANRLRFSWFIMGMLVGVSTMYFVIAPYQKNISPIMLVTDAETPTTSTEPLETIPSTGASKATTTLPTEPERFSIPAETVYPLTLTVRVENGDTLLDILTDAGTNGDEAQNIVNVIGKSYNAKKLAVGQSLTVQLDKDQKTPDKLIIQSLVLPVSLTASLELARRSDGSFELKETRAPISRTLKRASGRIEGSLYETLLAKGLTPALLGELITAYSYDVDFQRDIKRGDTIDLLYERMETKDGIPAGYGHIVYAKLTLGKRPLKIYRYVDKKNKADFYNAKGESVRKALLRTPVNGIKISSGFGMRNHPILGYSRMHRGVDFGAPIGTPIYAAGDGTVSYAGTKGAYGNYVRIQHNKTYATAYAHVTRFASGIKPGKRVRQGQVIAYVGNTGMSTGPHLHYEVLVNNTQVNPSGVKFKTGPVLDRKSLADFRKNIGYIENQLADATKSKSVAIATSDTPQQATTR